MTSELEGATVVDFPLRGERWVAVNAPGDRIPSHGTDQLGQRYWERVINGIPRSTDRTRVLPD